MLQPGHTLVASSAVGRTGLGWVGLGGAGGLRAAGRLGGAPAAFSGAPRPDAGWRDERAAGLAGSGCSGTGKGGRSSDRPTSTKASRTSSGTVVYQLPV